MSKSLKKFFLLTDPPAFLPLIGKTTDIDKIKKIKSSIQIVDIASLTKDTVKNLGTKLVETAQNSEVGTCVILCDTSLDIEANVSKLDKWLSSITNDSATSSNVFVNKYKSGLGTLFGVLNEKRDTILNATHPIYFLIVGPLPLMEAFSISAPDFWSVREMMEHL
jgi:hypothetical protein